MTTVHDIYTIIPQRPPMVMIDCMTQCSDTSTSTTYQVKDVCIFLDNNQLTAEGLMENIAQTCAARIGYLNLQAGHTVKLGFIGAVKAFVVTGHPEVGDTVTTTITIKEEIFGITLVDAQVMLNNKVVAETTMKIALSDIDAKQQ